DKNIGNLRDLEAMEKAEQEDAKTAKAADDSEKRKGSVSVTKGAGTAEAKDTTDLKDGMAFARIARVKALAHIHRADPLAVAEQVYPGDEKTAKAIQKAA